MRNLAGHPKATEHVRNELMRCSINIVESDKPLGEPKSMVYGELPGFRFTRAWYYYVVKGLVPLNIANELYNNVIGKTDIRVAGHCGCPPPEDWAKPFNPKTGREVLSWDKRDKLLELHSEGFMNKGLSPEDSLRKSCDRMNREFGNVEDFPKFVDSYHIDSELGLYIFVKAIK